MSHPTALAFILPASPLPRAPRRAATAHGRRPRPPLPAPAPCVCRRAPAALADGGKGGPPGGDNDDADGAARPKTWPGFKVWFSRRDVADADADTDTDSEPDSATEPDAGMDGRPVLRDAAATVPPPGEDMPAKPPPRRGPPPQVTVIPDVPSAQATDSQKAEGFRWPWTRGEQGAPTSVNAPPSNDQKTDKVRAPQSATPASPLQPPAQTAKARVTHSDTKPGSMLEVDPSDSRLKTDPGLQDRWKKMIGIIVPNKAAHPRAKKGPDASSASSADSEASTTDDGSATPSRRRRGIMELYMPPSEPGKDAETTEKSQQPWFGIPWKRDSQEMDTDSANPDGENSEDLDSGSESPVPADVRVKGVAEAFKNKISGTEKRDDVSPTEEKKKPWFVPPWAQQDEKDSEKKTNGSVTEKGDDTQRGSTKASSDTEKVLSRQREKSGLRSSADDDKKSKPKQKGWFRWPGSEEKTDDSEERRTIEISARDVSEEEEDKEKMGNEEDDQKTKETVVKGQIVELGRKNVEATEKSTTEKSSSEKGSEKEREPVLAASNLSSATPSSSKGAPADMVSIPQRDVAAIRLIFGSETFFATEALSAPGGLIFRGNLRGEPKATLTKLEARLKARLGDKYTLCLAEGEEDLRPVVVVVPTARDRRASTPRQKAMAVMVGLMTLSTCLGRGTAMNLLRPRIAANYGAPLMKSVVDKVLYVPIMSSLAVAVAISVLILASQMVQRAVAGRYRTRIAIPYVLPSYQLGSFGAVVQLASPTPTRAALFDIAMSGAMMLVVPSVICLIIGLRLSTAFPTVVPVPMSVVSNSMLMGALTRFVPNGQILVDYARSLIGLHPLAVIGANCLTIAAFNLLPMRQLDGGRIISALYGRKTAVHASRVTVLFLLLATSKNPSLIVYLLAVMLGPWHVDRPAKNELTEPDALRTLLGYAMMLLMIAILLPYPRSAFFGTL